MMFKRVLSNFDQKFLRYIKKSTFIIQIYVLQLVKIHTYIYLPWPKICFDSHQNLSFIREKKG